LLPLADKVRVRTTVSNDHFAWFLLTCSDESFRDAQRARKLVQSVTKAVPERRPAWRTLSLAHYRLGQWDAAEAALQTLFTSATDESTDAGALYLLAMIQWQKGERDEAREAFDRATAAMKSTNMSDSNIDILANEARLLLASKEN
jgi:tetratricopeptide (TPR) repeat protein